MSARWTTYRASFASASGRTDKVTEHRGQVLDFLAMTFDFTKSGEARVTMKCT